MKETKENCCQYNWFTSGKNSIRGITLVALVVTIVVLLILAGITLIYVFGDNGIIKLAQQAKNETEDAMQREQNNLGTLANRLKEEYGNSTGGGNNSESGDNTTNPPEEDKTVADVVDKIQTENKTVEDSNGNKITIPGGFKVVPDTTTNDVDYTYNGDKKPCVQDGIVIEDEEGNQFVWIPVGDIKNKDGTTTTITLGRYTFDTTNGTPTLKQNATNYSSTVTIDSYYQEKTSNDGNTAAKSLSTFVSKTNSNKGYYLGRYEASEGVDGKVDCQENKSPWVSITQPNAATKARGMYSSSYVDSDLINSYSWDTAIVFIQKYSGNSNYAKKASVNSSKENTGKAGDKACNIHDMASNCREWSTEHSTFTSSSRSDPCVDRGGNYNYNSSYTTSNRLINTTFSSYAYTSFRPLCYVK